MVVLGLPESATAALTEALMVCGALPRVVPMAWRDGDAQEVSNPSDLSDRSGEDLNKVGYGSRSQIADGRPGEIASKGRAVLIVSDPAGLNHDAATALWARHYLDAEFATRGMTRAFVRCSDLGSNPRAVIASVYRALGLSLDAEALDRAPIEQYLTDRSFFGPMGSDRVAAPPFAAEIFRVLSRSARTGELGGPDKLYLDQARQRMGQGEKGGPYGDEDHKSLGEASNNERDLAERLDAVTTELRVVKAKYRSTQEILARERGKLKETRAALASADLLAARIRSSHFWRFYLFVFGLIHLLRRRLASAVGSRSSSQRERIIAMVEASALFDRDWYFETYPDVAASGIDPLRHYLDNGWREGRDPGPRFSTTAYLRSHADVAAHGVNPLVHYVEFGHFEGRGAPEHAAPSRKRKHARNPLEPAALCVSFPVEQGVAGRWVRSTQIDSGAPDVHALLNGLAIGSLTDEGAIHRVRHALGQFALLSGGDASPADAASDALDVPCATMADAWFASANRLRSRWRRAEGTGPIVVRILQYAGSEPRLIGEARVTGDLDVIDARLVNQYFPLLFLFCDSAGAILGSRLLAFPSMCRGGLHYPEYVALIERSDGAPVDVCEATVELARGMTAITAGSHVPLISEVRVDLSGATGTSALFQPNFQHWLKTVARVSVGALPLADATAPERHLATAVRVDGGPARRAAGGALTLAGDMVPSIAALCALRGEAVTSAGSQDVTMPLIVAGADDWQPSLMCHPPERAPIETPFAQGLRFPILSLRGGRGPARAVPLYAVREADRAQPAEAELLVPVSGPLVDVPAPNASITWLFWATSWDEADLLQSLEALGAQVRSAPASIRFVGPVPDAAHKLAKRLFESRVQLVPDTGQLRASLDTPLVGHIGSGVILHDRRTSALLVRMLERPGAISASAALVLVERRGKGFLVTPADFGSIATDGTPLPAGVQLRNSASLLKCSSWDLLQPPLDLWVTRAEEIAGWIAEPGAKSAAGVHICSSVVTASYCRAPVSEPRPIVPHIASKRHSLRVEAVVG